MLSQRPQIGVDGNLTDPILLVHDSLHNGSIMAQDTFKSNFLHADNCIMIDV